jgi:hypothetical protein
MRIRSDRYRENFLYSLENKRDPDWMDHMVYEGRSALEPSVTAFLESRAVRGPSRFWSFVIWRGSTSVPMCRVCPVSST